MKTWNTTGIVVLLFALLATLTTHAVLIPDYPGDARVGTCRHAAIPADLSDLIIGVTQTQVDHTFITMTKDGVQGVFHSDGPTGARFTPWADFQELYVEGSVKLYKPSAKKIGLTELENMGLGCLPDPLKCIVAKVVGSIRICQWLQELEKYTGTPYDWFFMPGDGLVYCSEVLAVAWDKIPGITFPVFPTVQAGTLAGWNIEAFPGVTFGMIFSAQGLTADVLVYPPADVATSEYFELIEEEYPDGC